MIVGTVRILPPPHRRDQVLELLRSILGLVRAQEGCASCHIYEEHAPDDAVVLVEQWTSDESLDVHLRSDAYRRILAAIELSGGQPEIRFDHVTASEGLELVERTRGSPPGPYPDRH